MMDRVTTTMLQESITLAECLIKSEERLKRLKELNAPPTIIENEENLLRKSQNKVAQDVLATALLPQARKIVRMRQFREEALKNMLFGEICAAIEDIFIVQGGIDEFKSSQMQDISFQMQDSENNEAWGKFVHGIKNGEMEEVLLALYDLLVSAKTSLLHEELPPLPPPYLYRGKICSSKEMN
jgi:hypothetical protein